MLNALLVQIARTFKMKSRSSVRLMLGIVLIAMISFGTGNVARADTIDPGFDLFHTPENGAFLPGSNFGPNFPGIANVPLVGLQTGPGNTDTIVKRLNGLGDGATGVIQTEIVALSLKSINPVNLGGVFFDVFVALDPNNASMGEINVTSHDANGGTFDSFFDVFVEVTLFDAATGNFFATFASGQSDRITSTGSLWSHTAPPLYPNDPLFQAGNFFPGVDPVTGNVVGVEHTGPHPQTVPSSTEPVPEPATIALLGIGLAGLAGGAARRRLKKKKAKQ